MLQVDGRQGRGKLPQVRSGRADQRAQLSETPMSGCNLLIASRHHQGKPSRIVPVRFHPKARLFNRPRLRAFRPARHRLMEVRKVQKASVIEARKPLRGYAANPLPARHIHAEVTGKQGDRFGMRSQVQGRPGWSEIARPEGAARRGGLHKRVPIFRAWRRSTKARKTGETARVGVGPCHALSRRARGAGPLVDWKGDRTCGLRYYDDDEVGCGQDQHGRPHPRTGDETRFCAGHRHERPKRCTAQLSNIL